MNVRSAAPQRFLLLLLQLSLSLSLFSYLHPSFSIFICASAFRQVYFTDMRVTFSVFSRKQLHSPPTHTQINIPHRAQCDAVQRVITQRQFAVSSYKCCNMYQICNHLDLSSRYVVFFTHNRYLMLS